MPLLNRLPLLISTSRPVTLQHFSKRSFAIQPVLQRKIFQIGIPSIQNSLVISNFPSNLQLNRNYSPLPRKKVTRVAVEERPPIEEYQRQQRQQPLVNQDQDQYLNAQQQKDAQFAAQNQTRQIDHVTEEVGAHLRKVYLTMGGTFGLAAVGSLASLFLSPAACMVLGIGAIVPGLAIYFGTHSPEKVARRTLYLNAFGLLSGVGIAPLIKVALVMNPLYIAGAAGITAGIFGAMTALSLFMPSKSALRWGPALGGSCLVLLACGIGSMFVPVTSAFYPILHNVFLYAGLGIFSLFIAFDTQNIINDFEQGVDDHVRHALDLFIDVFGIFRRILYMFISRDD